MARTLVREVKSDTFVTFIGGTTGNYTPPADALEIYFELIGGTGWVGSRGGNGLLVIRERYQ